MSNMTLVHNNLLKALNDAIAERDAEIAQLKAELTSVIEGHEAQIANLKSIVAERSLKVTELEKWKDSLLAQVAELQANNTDLRYQIESYELGDDEVKFDV